MRNGRSFKISLIICLVSACPSSVWAAAAAKRMQQQKAMQEQMMQQQYQQAVAQKQAQEVAAYKQAIAQRQAQMQQIAVQQKAAAEYAAQKQAMQQAIARRAAEVKAAEEMKQMIAQKQAQEVAAYQQRAAYQQVRNMAAHKQAQGVQQAVAAETQLELNSQIRDYADYLAKRQTAMAQQAVVQQQAQTALEMAQYYERQKFEAAKNRIVSQNKIQEEVIRRRMGQDIGALAMASGPAVVSGTESRPDEPGAVVTIEELWTALDRESSAWGKIMDAEIKRLTVAEYIDRFRKIGIRISRSPGDYMDFIDSMAAQNEEFLKAPFLNVLSYAAVMEYDFDNGENKDELARKMLGEANFLVNKKRLLAR